MAGIFIFVVLLTACSGSGDKSGSSFSAKVDWVTDGDTIRLDDGRHVRLLGINTPELAKDGHATEPMAKEARQFLNRLVDSQTVQIIYGKQSTDKYGRLLAYVFLNDTDVQLELLNQGLASVVAIPPNTRMADRYLAAESDARSQQKGIWRQGIFDAISADKVDRSMDGQFKFVTGEVKNIRETRHNLLLALSEHFTVAIPHKDWEEYWSGSPNQLSGQTIEVRGWVYESNNELRVRVRHPVMLKILE